MLTKTQSRYFSSLTKEAKRKAAHQKQMQQAGPELAMAVLNLLDLIAVMPKDFRDNSVLFKAREALRAAGLDDYAERFAETFK